MKMVSANYKKDGAGGGPTAVRTAVASGLYVDRDLDLVMPQGLDAENFMKNPVMLNVHNYWGEAVGKVLDIRKTNTEVEFDFMFADTEAGRLLAYLYDHGFQNAFSVGFIPKNVVPVSEGVDELTVQSGGREVSLKLSEFNPKPRQIITDWELLEISTVPVPALPQALMRAAKGVVGYYQLKQSDSGFSVEEAEKLKDLLQKMEDAIDAADPAAEPKVKGAVRPHSTPIDEGGAWDADAATAALAKWASSDGSGDKDTIDWAKFRLGFAWYDAEAAENFTSYKLPHHTIRDGELTAVWRGVTAAMAALNGARGGVDLPDEDRQAVYAHLARHYKDAGAEPPELRDYTEAELKAMEDAPFPTAKAEPEPGDNLDDSLGDSVEKVLALFNALDAKLEGALSSTTLMMQRFEALEKAVRESEASFRVKWGILMEEIRGLGGGMGKGEPLADGATRQQIDGKGASVAELERLFDDLLTRL